ncbi:UNVERIFIED_CONTAM: hypothetical protein Sangu_1448100 [Sesamum angustifolium]|uniref:Transposase MuDR plant domain-containing protein n=1 Tax=Sesamum angustifolium TaxID=2727405 RepID=A0AAW2N6V9_9LAMI
MHLEYIEEGNEGGLINNVVIEEGNESDMNAIEDEDLLYDSDFNLSDDDMLFDNFVDPNVEFGGSNKGKFVEGSEWCSDDIYTIVLTENIEEEGCVHSDDDFDRTYGSDDEEKMKYQMYNPRAENKNPDLKLGLIFSSKERAKFAIQSHCLRRGMMMKFEKKDKKRLRAVCKKEGCTCMNEPPLPPLYKEKVGRPKRLRRREPDEPPAPTSNPFRDTGTETAATPMEASQSQQPDVPQFSSQPTQASASNEPAQNRGTRQKLPVRMPPKNKQAKPTRSTRIASVKINQSTSNIHTSVIVRGGMNFITLSNLRASFSNTATGNTSRLASELPHGVSRSTSRVLSIHLKYLSLVNKDDTL